MAKVSLLTGQAQAELLKYQENNGYLNDLRLESFGFFLADYIISGAELTFDETDNKRLFVSEGIISFRDQLWRSFIKEFRLTEANTTYYVGFLERKGYVLGKTEPTEGYLRFWSIHVNSDGVQETPIDYRVLLNKVKYKPGYYPLDSELEALLNGHTANLTTNNNLLINHTGRLDGHDSQFAGLGELVNLNSGGINVLSFGALADGIAIDSAAIDDALALTTSGSVQRVIIPDGTYLINKTIVIPRGVHLELGQKAIIKPTSGDFNIFQLKPEGRLTGGIVNLQSVTFTKAVYYLDAADVFQFYGQSHIIADMNVLNKVPTVAGAFTGTGILCEAKTNMGFIDNVKFNNLTFINFDKVIHLRVDPILDTMFASDPNMMAWVNANYFFQITAQNFKYGIYLEGRGAVPRDVAGNMFNQCQFQAEVTTENIVYCEGAYNIFDIFMWDVHKMVNGKQAVNFAQSSKFNRFYSAMQLEITESWKDKGYMNVISSPGNYVPNQRSLAQRFSTPFKGQFNGNQDDALINGNLRGYTVTQTSGVAPVGPLIDIFSPDTELGPTWDATTSSYGSPIVIEIDCTTDPIVYAQFIGTVHPWDAIPEGLLVEGYTGTEWIWLHEVAGNESHDYLVSPPYSGVNFLNKIRISFYGSPNANKLVTIGRVVAISSKNLGKAYIPQFTNKIPMIDANEVAWFPELNTDGTWKNVLDFPASSITPVLPGSSIMAGDQDDILLLADKRYTVNSTGALKTSGNIFDMFSLKRENFCRWTAPTTGAPIVIEIDFGSTPIEYMESIGVNFGWGETAKNIKVERVLSGVGGSYVQLLNITDNLTSSEVHRASRAVNVYKIRLTISVANNPNTLVRITRIYATAATTLPATFVNTEADNKVYGDLEFGDTLKGTILTSPDGSRWKNSISDTGVIAWTKLP